jgi:GNAT superfamily N-acetyltransferase
VAVSNVATWDPAAAYFAAIGNFVGTWKAIATVLPTGDVTEVADGGAVLVATGMPIAMFNPGFVLDEANPDVDTILRAATEYFGDRKLPFALRMHESISDAFSDAAPSYGLHAGARSPIMVLDPIPSSPPLPAGASVQRVEDTAGLALHRSLAARGFGAPLELMETFLPDAIVEHDVLSAVVVRVDDEPASTAALVETATTPGMAGIYNVATPEEFRRRGLGEAATWAALEIAAERGHTAATLQASEMGLPIYERMGFRVVAWWRDVTNG